MINDLITKSIEDKEDKEVKGDKDDAILSQEAVFSIKTPTPEHSSLSSLSPLSSLTTQIMSKLSLAKLELITKIL